jgi:hypothetical protein
MKLTHFNILSSTFVLGIFHLSIFTYILFYIEICTSEKLDMHW